MTEYSPEDRTSSPEAIERDIEQTRERMSQNIDALGHKLSPRNLKQQAKEAISGAAHDAAASVSDKARRTGSKVIESLRENAVPVAMVGAGVTWMIMKRSDASSQRRGYTTGGYAGEERRGVSRYVGTTSAREEFGYGSPSYRGSHGSAEAAEGYGIRQKVSHAADAVGAKVSHAASAVGEKVSDAASTVADKTGVLARRVGDLSGEARDRVQHAGSQARGSFERTLEENPLAIAAGAAVLGLAIGLLFPATRRENEMMGPTRDRLVDTAQETARTVKEVARERTQVIASEKAPELKEAARELVEQVKEGAGRVAQETKDAAKATVKEQKSARRSNA